MSEFNVKSTTLEKAIEGASSFLSKIVGPSLDTIGEVLADKVKLWRLENQIRNLNKVKAMAEKGNVKMRQVNLKVLFPCLDAMSLEDDEKLQDMWAKLFLNYIDIDKNLKLNVYPDILRQLSTNEIRVLEYMRANKGILKVDWMHRDEQEVNYAEEEIANLERLGIIEEGLNLLGYATDSSHVDIEHLMPETYYITEFGDQFIAACER